MTKQILTMPDRKPQRPPRRLLTWWFGFAGVAGLGFGLIAERRPLGDDVLAHPIVLLFVTMGAVLLALRIVAARPVPELIPERSLLYGIGIAFVTFLIGNWFAVHVLAMR